MVHGARGRRRRRQRKVLLAANGKAEMWMHKFHTLRLTSVERENEQKNQLNCGSVATDGNVRNIGRAGKTFKYTFVRVLG